MKVCALRLKPNEDLKQSLTEFVKINHLESGFILTAVGSFQQVTLRFSGHPYAQAFKSLFEIISLVGTLSPDGLHLHMAVADASGKIIGGHLMDGCIIYTTAEIIIGSSEDLTFIRSFDDETGYNELEIIHHN